MTRPDVLGAAALLLLPSCTVAAQTPPPHVEYEPPLRSRVVAAHECPSGPVSIEVEGEWRLPGTGRVRVVAYSGAAGAASQADIDRWNFWLTDLDGLGGVSIRCQQGANEAVDIEGLDGRTSRTVSVWWQQGQLGLFAQAPR